MPGNIQFSVDTKSFKKACDEAAQKWGLDAKALLMDQMRLWVLSLVKFAPPQTLSQGRKSIATDLRKVFVPVADKKVLDFYRKLMPGEEAFRPLDVGGMRSIHDSMRDSRGRMKSRPRRLSDIIHPQSKQPIMGKGHKPMQVDLNKRYVRQADLNKLQRDLQAHVGKTKAGWKAAAAKFLATLQSWVARQPSMGSAEDAMTTDGSGYLEAINSIPWIGRLAQQLETLTLSIRKRDLAKGLEKRVEKLAAQFSSR